MTAGRTPTSMAARVMRATIWSAGAGGAFAAVVAIVTLDALVRDHDDQRLRAATVTLAGEIDEDRGEAKQDPLDATLDDENDEIVTSGIRLAVYERGAVIAGDAWAPLAAPGHCETFGRVGERVRVCAKQYERWVLVAAKLSDQSALRWLFALAGIGAVVLGAGMAALLGRRLSRWAVAPLVDLTQRLEDSDPEKAQPRALNVSDECLEVNAIAQALTQLLQRVQVLLEQARRLAADASHELRTPLAALCVELELLSERLSGDTGQLEVRAALARAQQLGVLVERLLLLAAPVDQLRGGFEPVALVDLAQDVLQDFGSAQQARTQLVSNVEGLVHGDCALLRSLLNNALCNAFKYSDGAVTVRIEEHDAAGDDGARVHSASVKFVDLSIEDSGPGIAEQLRARVFEPFFRTQPGVGSGHGLGLALVAHIARAHAADVQFLPSASGACLRVRFPAWRAASSLPESS